jgi:hypothetical protein
MKSFKELTEINFEMLRKRREYYKRRRMLLKTNAVKPKGKSNDQD